MTATPDQLLAAVRAPGAAADKAHALVAAGEVRHAKEALDEAHVMLAAAVVKVEPADVLASLATLNKSLLAAGLAWTDGDDRRAADELDDLWIFARDVAADLRRVAPSPERAT